MEQRDAVYLCFLEVLKQTGQQHIYEKLVEDGYKGEYSAIACLVAEHSTGSDKTSVM